MRQDRDFSFPRLTPDQSLSYNSYPSMSRKAATAALFFGLLGLIVSALAAYTHYHMLRDPLYTSFCDVSTSLSCTEVYKSR